MPRITISLHQNLNKSLAISQKKPILSKAEKGFAYVGNLPFPLNDISLKEILGLFFKKKMIKQEKNILLNGVFHSYCLVSYKLKQRTSSKITMQ